MITKANNITQKTNTDLLIGYLEGAIGDEMIMNSFIRDLVIIESSKTKVTIASPSADAIKAIKNDYDAYIRQGIEAVYEEPLGYEIVLKGTVKESNDMKQLTHISKKFTFENLVQADFNETTIKMAKKIIEKPGMMSPLYITAKSGLGKTHLLHAIGNAAAEKKLSAIYIEPNKLTSEITRIAKEKGGDLIEYTNSFSEYDFILFDDIQNLGDRDVTLNILFNIINHNIQSGKQIVICSDTAAEGLHGFQERFITRFVSGLTSIISHPSETDLAKILLFKLGEVNLKPEKWEKEAIKFIVRNYSASIRSLEGAIKRVQFFTEDVGKIQYTVGVINNIFKDLEVDKSELTTERIIKTVSTYYQIKKAQLLSKTRKKEIVIARHMAMYLIKVTLDKSYKEIGLIFGGRDHSTVISAINNIERDMKMNNAVKLAKQKIENKFKKIN